MATYHLYVHEPYFAAAIMQPTDSETQFASFFLNFKLWASFTVKAGAKMAKSPIISLPWGFFTSLSKIASSESKVN